MSGDFDTLGVSWYQLGNIGPVKLQEMDGYIKTCSRLATALAYNTEHVLHYFHKLSFLVQEGITMISVHAEVIITIQYCIQLFVPLTYAL